MTIISKSRRLRICTIACVSSMLVPLNAQANDEAKNLAIGIGAGLLLKGIEAMAASSEQPQEADEASNQSVTENKLQYSQEVADAQSNLKELGYYKGSVDGLKGQQTYQAIEAWRQATDSEDTGELNVYEHDVLKDFAETSRENRSYQEKRKQNAQSPKQHKKRLSISYGQYFSQKDEMQICSDFAKSPHLFAPSIDADIHENFEYALSRFETELEIMPNCYDISSQEASIIKEDKLNQYKQSHKGKRNEMALLLKHRIDDSQAMARVDGCNALSRRMFLFKAKNDTPSCELINKT